LTSKTSLAIFETKGGHRDDDPVTASCRFIQRRAQRRSHPPWRPGVWPVKVRPEECEKRDGRRVVVAVGIDRYSKPWSRLANAGRDAEAARRLFGHLGFAPLAVLLDEDATLARLRQLVFDELMALGPDDDLILYLAGHGAVRQQVLDGHVIITGYFVPVDATEQTATWFDLEAILRAIGQINSRHVLCFFDCCFSGAAVARPGEWRDVGRLTTMSSSALHGRRGRRVISSAMDDESASDSGPISGHSIFFASIVEALTWFRTQGNVHVSGAELGAHVQRYVSEYTGSRQTPASGVFAYDRLGELFIPLRPSDSIELRAAIDIDPVSIRSVCPGPNRIRRRAQRWRTLAVAGAAVAASVGGMAIATPRWLGGFTVGSGAAIATDTPSAVPGRPPLWHSRLKVTITKDPVPLYVKCDDGPPTLCEPRPDPDTQYPVVDCPPGPGQRCCLSNDLRSCRTSIAESCVRVRSVGDEHADCKL
jgi:hypothetical protein